MRVCIFLISINQYLNYNNSILYHFLELSFLKINDLSDLPKIFDKYMPIFDIKADNNISNSHCSIKESYNLTKNN